MRASLLVLLLPLAACFGEPDYEGRLCGPTSTCPSGLTCGADLRCHKDLVFIPSDAGPIRPPIVFDGGTDDPLPDPDGSEGPDNPEGGPTDAALADGSPDRFPPPRGDAGVGRDAQVPDAPRRDAGGAPDPARCLDPVHYPTVGWEGRTFSLTAADAFDVCLGVETVPTEPLDRDFGSGGPIPGVNERYGTRYTARRTFSAGVYTFTASHDDGMRLYIDGALIYQDWNRGIVRLNVIIRTPYLAAGAHDIMIEHFQHLGAAQIRARWEAGCGTLRPGPTGWTLGFYRLQGTTIDRAQCYGVETLQTDQLGVDWTMNPPTAIRARGLTSGWAAVGVAHRRFRGTTQITATHNGGMRILADNFPVLNQLGGPSAAPQSVDVYLPREHDIGFELLNSAGTANASIGWQQRCALALPTSATTWATRYYRVLYNGAVNPPTWTLDYDDCLYAEVISTPMINFDWTLGAPAVLASAFNIHELWGAEFTGPRTFTAATTIHLVYDDGLRISSDGVLVFNDWSAPHAGPGSFVMAAGTHNLWIRYFQNLGAAQLHMTW